jgi:hypothetical protein
LWLKNLLPSVRPATKSVATVASKAATVMFAAMMSASLAKSVHRVKNAHHARSVSHVKFASLASPVKKHRQSPAKNAHHALLVKNVRRVLRAKIASLVASAKNAFANCASLWMPLQPLLLPLKSVQLASHAKNALHARRVKNVNHVPNKLPQPQPKKN